MTVPRVFRVALDMPLRRLFDYLPPEARLAARPAPWSPACASACPFGRQRLVGVIMEIAASSDVVRGAAEADSGGSRSAGRSSIRPPWGCSRWAAEYYHHPIGEVLAAALPKALRLGRQLP